MVGLFVISSADGGKESPNVKTILATSSQPDVDRNVSAL